MNWVVERPAFCLKRRNGPEGPYPQTAGNDTGKSRKIRSLKTPPSPMSNHYIFGWLGNWQSLLDHTGPDQLGQSHCFPKLDTTPLSIWIQIKPKIFFKLCKTKCNLQTKKVTGSYLSPFNKTRKKLKEKGERYPIRGTRKQEVGNERR